MKEKTVSTAFRGERARESVVNKAKEDEESMKGRKFVLRWGVFEDSL